jgi:cellulose synthase (UDP-forming)
LYSGQQVTADERFIRLKFDENIPLSRRRELVRVVLARADAWINPPRPQDNPFRSFSPFYAACSNCSG